MKLYAALCLLFVASLTVSCRTCDLPIEQAPDIHGFRLVMTTDEIKKEVEKLSGIAIEIAPDDHGLATVEFEPSPSARIEAKKIKIQLIDGRMASISAFYNAPLPDPLQTKECGAFVIASGTEKEQHYYQVRNVALNAQRILRELEKRESKSPPPPSPFSKLP